MRTVTWAVFLGVFVRGFIPTARGANCPCDTVVGQFRTEFIYKVPSSRLARVEIRQCSPEDSGTIQLVAWRSRDTAPALVIDTDDFGVVQTAARANVFVIETSGATRNQVFVIMYKEGNPKLALRRLTKGTARIRMSKAAVDLVIEGIYAGDAPERAESHHLALDIDGMKRR